MAVTFTLIRATDYRLLYTVTRDGAGGDAATRTNAQLQADAPVGSAIANLLATAVANDAAALLLMVGTPGRTYITPGGDPAVVWSMDWSQAANLVQVTARAAAASDAILEIQLVHTFDR